MGIKVTLREKKISNGRVSLYLDFYPPINHPTTGKPTRREFLGMYILEKANDPIKRNSNKETKALAEQIRHKRENDLNKPEIYSAFEKEQLRIKEIGEKDFVEYYTGLANKRKSSNYDNWMSALKFLENFTGGSLLFKELNDFKEYLLTTKSRKSDKINLSQNSAVSYFNKIKAALKQAFKDGLLQTDLNSKIDAIKPEDTSREFLSLDELNMLVKTECKNEQLKTASLFSALTGLRFSDIKKMYWKEVIESNDGYFIKFKQKKTGGNEYLPISEQAFVMLGQRKEDDQKVFEELKYSAYQNKFLKEWIKRAGIKKEITFHCFRHTYATLQLFNGTDIYTLSKMLGHKDLKTTQIYTKIVDQAKREATTKIKLDL